MKFVKRTWTEINLDAASHNFRTIKNSLPDGTKLCCVIKADGYGHGAVELAHLYSELGADFFAVSNLDEGKELRDGGITEPILVLGYTPPNRAAALAEFNISQTVYSLSYAELLSQEAAKAGLTCKIHIKLDTGMGRLGFMCQQFPRDNASLCDIKRSCELAGLEPEGIFTHFSVSDEGARGKEFTRKQLSDFNYAIGELKKLGVTFKIHHCSNSGAIEDYPEAALNMVRAGIILYGLSPSQSITNKLPLKPVMTLKSVVSYVKEISAGTTVSYGKTFAAEKNMKVATIPIGYADGYIRQYSSGYMLVKGKKAKILGRICMDQTIIDVSDIEDVKIGDEVLVFGDGSHGEPTAETLAAISDTINYEVLCIIGKRVPRLFIKNGKVTDVMYKL